MSVTPDSTIRGVEGLEACIAALGPANPYQGESLTLRQGMERDIGLCLADMAEDYCLPHLSQTWGGFEIHAFRTAHGLYAVVTLAEPETAAAPPDPG